MSGAPWFDQPAANTFAGYVATRIDPEFKRLIRECDQEATRREAEVLLIRVRDEYGDVMYRNAKLSTLAENELAKIASKRPAAKPADK